MHTSTKVQDEAVRYGSVLSVHVDGCNLNVPASKAEGIIKYASPDKGLFRTEQLVFFAGKDAFSKLSEEEPGTFYLTDFLTKNFERLVVRGLKLDQYPELIEMFFGNYKRVVYLVQSSDPVLNVTVCQDGTARQRHTRLWPTASLRGSCRQPFLPPIL